MCRVMAMSELGCDEAYMWTMPNFSAVFETCAQGLDELRLHARYQSALPCARRALGMAVVRSRLGRGKGTVRVDGY